MCNNKDLHLEYIHIPISVYGKSTNCSSNWGDMRWLDGRAYAFNIFQVHIVVNVIMCLVALVSVGMRLGYACVVFTKCRTIEEPQVTYCELI